jgi:hypothetical protein
MSRYFNYFPKTLYSSNNATSSLDTITNITARFGFESSLKENSNAFYQYSIKDSDTPEIIAAKFYSNPERHWIVLMFNDIIDPQYDWPMENRTLMQYIDKKYSANGGLSWAMNVTHVKAYYKTITRTSFDGTKIVEKVELDSGVYANTAATTESIVLQDGSTITQAVTKSTQSYYDYEIELNEQKRTIKLVKAEFVPQIEKEFKKIIK